MEFYRLTIPIPKQPWLWVRFRITTVLLLIAILAILLAWRRDHRQLAAEVALLQYPGPHYEPAQAVGPPDVLHGGDSPNAWCPGGYKSGKEWLDLEYDTPVVPSAILVCENYSSGAIVRVTHVPRLGPETTLWEGTYSATAGPDGSDFVSKLPITNSMKTGHIKVYLDTAQAVGWNEIDAVGLVDASGQVSWASHAHASSTWGEPTAAARSQFSVNP